MRFLLAEDSDIAADAVTAALCAEGHDVDVTHNGREVIGLIADKEPDVVILDISLPDLDGVTVAKLIRMDRPTLPIVFTSGHETFDGLEEAKRSSHTAVLQKPYEISELIAIAEAETRN